MARTADAIWLRLLLLALGVAGASCGGSSTEVAGLDVVGVYDLVSFDGDPIPALFAQSGDDFTEVTSGFIDLRIEGSLVAERTLRSTINGQVSTEVETFSGDWARSGTRVDLIWDGGCPGSATISGEELSFVGCTSGRRWVFRK